MGVRARRWQLWLITTFILTGMIGMIQLFKGPESVGAVQVAGGAANPTVVMPSRSVQATELPSWTPTAQPTQNSASSQDVDVVRVPRTSSAAVAPAAPTSSKQATQFPTPTVPSQPASRPTIVTAKSITPTAPATTAKPTTVTSSATKPATTKPVTTTTQAKPVPSPVKSTAPTGPKRPGQQQPRCVRILWFTFCR